MRLMSGKKVNKYELMEKFDKKESTVQRDIAKIESLIEMKFTVWSQKRK